MISVILCGGAGSRLWPVSRELHPKPFIRLPDGQSFIQKSFLRAAELPWTAEIMTVTNRELHFKIVEEFKALGADRESSYILEPFGRNTAPAIALAALEIRRRHGDEAPVLILAADHLISRPAAFAEAVEKALALANEDRLVAFGIKPSSPDTGFGYIEAKGTEVLRFVEKPDEKRAQEYLAAGNFLWNAGMFCFKAGVMLRELALWAPELLAAAET
ncbi:MAG: NTP transferase domain-containing protein, partial [Candidatus Adiutrix sp.]|nr:NTP transferase domain-containing protein [Candidatus Adiutrix sp.]